MLTQCNSSRYYENSAGHRCCGDLFVFLWLVSFRAIQLYRFLYGFCQGWTAERAPLSIEAPVQLSTLVQLVGGKKPYISSKAVGTSR